MKLFLKYSALYFLFIFGLIAWAQVDAAPTSSGDSFYLVDTLGNAYTSSSSGTIRALDVRDRWAFDQSVSGTSATITAINNLNTSNTAITSSTATAIINTLNANNASNTAITSAGTTAIVNEIKSASASNTLVVNQLSASNTAIVTSATTSLINTLNANNASNTAITSSTATAIISTLNINSASQVAQSVSSTVYIATAIEKSIYDPAVVSDRNDGGAINPGNFINVTYPAVPAGQVMEVKELWGHSTAAWRFEVYVDGVMKFDNTNIANSNLQTKCPPFRLTAGQVLQIRKYNRNAVGAASVYSILWYAMRTL